jgi:hypothetical protein
MILVLPMRTQFASFKPIFQILLSAVIVGFFVTLSPTPEAQAQGLVTVCNMGTNCSACDLADLANNVIQWLIGIMFLLFAIITVVAGFGLVTSNGNTSALQDAKKKLTNGIIGIVIVLAAWLLVDTMMRGLLGNNGEIEGFGPWSQIQCGTQAPTTINTGLYEAVSYLPPQVGVSPGVPPTLNPGGAGACIIRAESTCGARNISTTDRMRFDNRPFSFGAMQINITVHRLVGCGSSGQTLNCPAAFSGRNYAARVTNESLYNECAAAAQNLTCNLTNGRIIRQARGSWADWSTARGCGLI